MRWLAIFLASVIVGGLSTVQAARFYVLDESYGDNVTIPRLISPDGTAVVGYSSLGIENHREAFRWTRHEGMVGLGISSVSFASADLSVLVGNSEGQAFRWTQGEGLVSLGIPPVSVGTADFSVLVGSNEERVFRWTEEEGMVDLGELPCDECDGMFRNGASAVSADGNVVVGVFSDQAFRWTQEDGMVGLGFLSWAPVSHATSVSADGAVVVGFSPAPDEYGDLDWQGFRWTEQEGMVRIFVESEPLGCIHVVGSIEDFCTCWVEAASSDSSVKVGECTSQHGGGRLGFVWLAGRKMLEIREALAAQSDISDIDLGQMGWSDSSVTAVSDNGKFIAGWGFDWDNAPGGAWFANIPEPSTLVLIAVGLAGFVGHGVRARLRC
jgi:uncharacterized membrane protein